MERKRKGYSKEGLEREGKKVREVRGSGEEKKRKRSRKKETRRRKKERRKEGTKKWTLNRSPHGNKTAREQRGREMWSRKRSVGGLLEEERVGRRNMNRGNYRRTGRKKRKRTEK